PLVCDGALTGSGQAVGSTQYRAWAERWNGSSWSIVPGPNIYRGGNYLKGVAALSSNDIWAVGTYYGSVPEGTLVEHWDGETWSVIPSPNPGTFESGLNGVAVASASHVWAVGTYNNSNAH